jgi:Helicase HerA, central domain
LTRYIHSVNITITMLQKRELIKQLLTPANYIKQYQYTSRFVFSGKQKYCYFTFTGFYGSPDANNIIIKLKSLNREIKIIKWVKSSHYGSSMIELKDLQNKTNIRKKRLANSFNILAEWLDRMDMESGNLDEYSENIEKTIEQVKEKTNTTNISLIIRITIKNKADGISLLDEMEDLLEDEKITTANLGIQDSLHQVAQTRKTPDKLFKFNILPETNQLFYPFIHATEKNQLCDVEEKIFLGKDTNSHTPVWLPTKYNNKVARITPIFATTGAGKSHMIGQLIDQLLYTPVTTSKQKMKHRVILVDPKPEYQALAKKHRALMLTPQDGGTDILSLKQFETNVIDPETGMIVIDPKTGKPKMHFDSEWVLYILTLVFEGMASTPLTTTQKQELLDIIMKLYLASNAKDNLTTDEKKEIFFKHLEDSETLKNFVNALKYNQAFDIVCRSASKSLDFINDKMIYLSFNKDNATLPILLSLLRRLIEKTPFDTAVPTSLWIDELSEFFMQKQNEKEELVESRRSAITQILKIIRYKNIKVVVADQFPESYGPHLRQMISLCSEMILGKHTKIQAIGEYIPEEVYDKIMNFPVPDESNADTALRYFYYHNKNKNMGVIFHPFSNKKASNENSITQDYDTTNN